MQAFCNYKYKVKKADKTTFTRSLPAFLIKKTEQPV